MKKIAALIAFLLLLSGCSQSDENSADESVGTQGGTLQNGGSDNDDSEDDEELQYFLWSYEDKYAYCQENYPDKTILTWLTPSEVFREPELNEYLYENGYDYVICFDVLDGSASGSTYIECFEETLNSGEDFDIVSSVGPFLGQDAVTNGYYYMADMGVFEPLDEYITDEKYSEYYNSLPQEYWDSYKYQGVLYGVDNSYSSMYSDYGIAINSDALSESGIDPEEFNKPFVESGEAYKELYDKTGGSVIFSLAFDTDAIFPAAYLTFGIAVSGNQAVNVFELPEVIDYYSTMQEFAENEYIAVNPVPSPETGELEVEEIGDNVAATGTKGEIVVDENSGMTYIYNEVNNNICSPGSAHGVYSESKNKDSAVDALFNVMFNKDINNSTEPFDVSLYETAEPFDGVGFYFDVSEIQEEYLSVMNQIMKFNPSPVGDMAEYLEEFNQQLYDAGLQEVLDEANRQLEVYYEENN